MGLEEEVVVVAVEGRAKVSGAEVAESKS